METVPGAHNAASIAIAKSILNIRFILDLIQLSPCHLMILQRSVLIACQFGLYHSIYQLSILFIQKTSPIYEITANIHPVFWYIELHTSIIRKANHPYLSGRKYSESQTVLCG